MHRRSSSRGRNSLHSVRSSSPPSQTYHPSIIPRSIPTPSLVESVAGGAHYSGVRVDPETAKQRRMSHERHSSHSELNSDHRRVLDDLKELYCCRPTMEIFERSWQKDAVFEDSFSKCKGYDEFVAQFYALPKIFSKSETVTCRVLSSTSSPNRLVFALTQEYTFRLLGHKKVVSSIIIADLDEDEKIIRLIDQSDGKEPASRFGAHLVRRMNAKVVPWLVHPPKQSLHH